MKKLTAALFASFMLLGLFSVAASAGHGDGPGPNGSNDKGLCTAYFNGQKKGHDKQDESPGPFAGLEQHADDGDGDDPNDPDDGTDDREDEMQISDDVFEFCEGMIGGQPEHNGRYDCRTEDGLPRNVDGDDEYECLDNTGEGDTGGDHPSGKDK